MPDAVLSDCMALNEGLMFLPGFVIYAGKVNICSLFICCSCTVCHRPSPRLFLFANVGAHFSASTKSTVMLHMSNRVCFPTDVRWQLCGAVCAVEENDNNPVAFQASRCLPPGPPRQSR